MAEKIKKHKNGKGEWSTCSASQRRCRYVANEHKFVKVDEPSLVVKKEVPVKPVEEVVVPAEEEVEVQDDIVYRISPDARADFERNIDKANRRLERAGIEERFEVEFVETTAVNPDTGVEYVVLEATLNRPVISYGDWTFAGKVDYFVNEKDEQVISIRGFNGKDLTGEYETSDAVRCDHCGHRRSRNKTFVVKSKEGEYKQVGSNCLQAFLGVRPKGLWALDEDIVDNDRFNNRPDNRLTWNPRFMLINTKNVVALGLALSNGGKDYGASSSGRPTKNLVAKYILGDKKDMPENVDVASHVGEAEKIMKETVFDTSTDYGRNMSVLLAEENTTFHKIGYVVSVIPAYMKQTNLVKRPEKAKGFVGNVGEKITDIPDVTVENVVEIPNNFSYYGGTNLMVVMRTSDNKVLKWVTASQDERLSRFEKGTRINLNTVTVKGHDEWNNEDQTVLKNVKFDLVDSEPVE